MNCQQTLIQTAWLCDEWQPHLMIVEKTQPISRALADKAFKYPDKVMQCARISLAVRYNKRFPLYRRRLFAIGRCV
jgi:hypothetical protein